MFGSKSIRPAFLALSSAALLAGCMEAGLGGGAGTGTATAAAGGGGDGPVFVSDERGCKYEVILGQRYPIVDANGRQQCSSL